MRLRFLNDVLRRKQAPNSGVSLAGPMVASAVIVALLISTARAQADTSAIDAIAKVWTGLGWQGSCPGQCTSWRGIEWSGSGDTVVGLRFPSEVKLTVGSPATWPGALWNLTLLRVLFMDNQDIVCIPTNVNSLVSLEELTIRGSLSFSPCPWRISNPKLTLLSMDHNGLTGTFPTELAALTSLERLNLEGNNYSPPLPNLALLTNVTFIVMDAVAPVFDFPTWLTAGKWQWIEAHSMLKGFLPLTATPSLRELILPGNNFTGLPFPPIGQLSGGQNPCQLQSLDLSDTNLTAAAFPIDLLTCVTLGSIALNNLDLGGGTIPSVLGAITSLYKVALNSANITGTIPTELGRLTNLQILELSVRHALAVADSDEGADLKPHQSNRISGTLPSELGNLHSVTNLGLIELGVSGPLPEEWAFMTSLFYFSIKDSHNITGQVPGWAVLVGGSVELQGNNFTNCTTTPYIDLPAGDTPLYGGATIIHTYGNVRICRVCVPRTSYPTQLNRCPWPRPLPNGGCFKGSWTVPSDLVVPAGGRVNVSAPITILGSFSQGDNTTITISVNGPLPATYLNVSGAANVDGVLEIVLTETPSSGIVTVLSSPQVSGNYTQIRVVDNTNAACTVTAEQRITATSVEVLIDSSAGCGGKHSSRKKYIIAGAVAGAVLISIGGSVVLWYMRKHLFGRRLFHEAEGDWVVT